MHVPLQRDKESAEHHANLSVQCTSPYTPLLYSKTGVYRGIHFFLNEAVLMCTHNQCFRAKKEKYYNFQQQINIFTALKYCCILHGHVCVMISYDILKTGKDKTIMEYLL